MVPSTKAARRIAVPGWPAHGPHHLRRRRTESAASPATPPPSPSCPRGTRRTSRRGPRPPGRPPFSACGTQNSAAQAPSPRACSPRMGARGEYHLEQGHGPRRREHQHRDAEAVPGRDRELRRCTTVRKRRKDKPELGDLSGNTPRCAGPTGCGLQGADTAGERRALRTRRDVWEPFGGLCTASAAAIAEGRSARAAEPDRSWAGERAEAAEPTAGASEQQTLPGADRAQNTANAPRSDRRPRQRNEEGAGARRRGANAVRCPGRGATALRVRDHVADEIHEGHREQKSATEPSVSQPAWPPSSDHRSSAGTERVTAACGRTSGSPYRNELLVTDETPKVLETLDALDAALRNGPREHLPGGQAERPEHPPQPRRERDERERVQPKNGGRRGLARQTASRHAGDTKQIEVF